MTTRARRTSRGLRVAVTDHLGRPLSTRAAGHVARELARVAPRAARGTVTVALVPDVVMARLNRVYRAKPGPTDVLSFRGERGRRVPLNLGDLAIATGVARRQARRLGHSYGTELTILALHGLLHLLGYDHEADEGEMARAEARLRRRAGLPPGLIQRHHTSRRR